jgi:nucleoside 2-deoxyribosyltransferase
MAMNIYFAGSICGGRQDRELYYKIIEHLRQYGKVLTKHIADRDLTEKGEDNTDDRAIHDRDLAWLQSSDLVIAEVTTPSLGVGYEVARAVQFSKRVLCLYRPQAKKRLSAMIAESPDVVNKQYSSLAQAKRIINGFIGP